MKEHPILFSGPMVRALLDGTKTQTRRILKVPHENPLGKWEVLPWGGPNGGRTRDGKTVPFQNVIGHTRTGEIIGCPYGQPGDRLWVREAWRTAKSLDAKSPSVIGDMCMDAGYRRPWAPLAYEADGHRNSEWRGFELHGQAEPGKYRPPMFMPRWASRITLEITAVRVERLQDISEADALAEGVERSEDGFKLYEKHWGKILKCTAARRSYESLWEQINGPGSWDANPWVWVVEFRRLVA